MCIVVRNLEMIVGAELDCELAKDVRRTGAAVHRAERAGIEVEGITQQGLESQRAGV